MVHFIRHDLCSCGSPKSPFRLGIMSQYLPDIFQTFMLTNWHTQKVPYACALDFANMAQIACKIGYFVSGQKYQLWHRQWTLSTQFFSTKNCIHNIGTYLKRFGYSELTLGPFEKMTFFPPDPLTIVYQQYPSWHLIEQRGAQIRCRQLNIHEVQGNNCWWALDGMTAVPQQGV